MMGRSLVFILLLLGGCQMFPRDGTGGFAEHRATLEPPLYWGEGYIHHSLRTVVPLEKQGRVHMATWLNTHLRQIGCLDYAFQNAVRQGARDYFPATIWQIERRRVRLLRLTSAGLEHDAISARFSYRDGVYQLEKAMREQVGLFEGDETCPAL